MNQLSTPLLENGSSRSKTSQLGPVMLIAFLNSASNVITRTPALCLQFQDLAMSTGMDAASTSTAFGLLTAARLLVELSVMHALAHWSDRAGLKLVMCLCCAACLLESLLLATSRSWWSFSIAHTMGGLLSSHCAAEGSCIVDATAANEARAEAFERLFLLHVIALIFGPPLSGNLSSQNRITPFVMAAILSGSSLAYAVLRMPEYKPMGRRRREPSAGPRPSFMAFMQLLAQDTSLGCYTVAYALSGLGLSAFVTVRTLWVSNSFGWDGSDIGRVVACYGMTLLVSHFILLPLLLWGMHGREPLLAQFCLLVFAARFAFYGLATCASGIYAALFLSTVGICGIPVLQGLCGGCLAEDQQGVFSAGVPTLNTCMQILGSLIGSQLYAASLRGDACASAHLFFSAVCFALAAGVLVPAQIADFRKRRRAVGLKSDCSGLVGHLESSLASIDHVKHAHLANINQRRMVLPQGKQEARWELKAGKWIQRPVRVTPDGPVSMGASSRQGG